MECQSIHITMLFGISLELKITQTPFFFSSCLKQMEIHSQVFFKESVICRRLEKNGGQRTFPIKFFFFMSKTEKETEKVLGTSVTVLCFLFGESE